MCVGKLARAKSSRDSAGYGAYSCKAITDIQGITLRKPPYHYASSPYAGLTARAHSLILMQKFGTHDVAARFASRVGSTEVAGRWPPLRKPAPALLRRLGVV